MSDESLTNASEGRDLLHGLGMGDILDLIISVCDRISWSLEADDRLASVRADNQEIEICTAGHSDEFMNRIQLVCQTLFPTHVVHVRTEMETPVHEIRYIPTSAEESEGNTASVFDEIYRTNRWESPETVSGYGSTLDQTGAVTAALPKLLRRFRIRTMLDLPCGDFNWMQHVDLSGIAYMGADIVGDLVEANQQYTTESIRFCVLDLLTSELPNVDLILTRDCFVHLTFEQILIAFENIVGSGIQWILATTFFGRRENQDIDTGDWRPLNLELPPFCLPQPVRLINEKCTEGDGAFADKCLGLWHRDDISRALQSRS